MTPLEALVELTNMGVGPLRIGETKVRELPALYDTIMEECGEPGTWVHLMDNPRTPCDSEFRYSTDGLGGVYVCDKHDRRVVYGA